MSGTRVNEWTEADHSRCGPESESGGEGGEEEDTVPWDTKATGWEAEGPVCSPGTIRAMCETSGKSFSLL